jgi:hypothetical protein
MLLWPPGIRQPDRKQIQFLAALLMSTSTDHGQAAIPNTAADWIWTSIGRMRHLTPSDSKASSLSIFTGPHLNSPINLYG